MQARFHAKQNLQLVPGPEASFEDDGFTNLQFDEKLDKFERRRNEQNNEIPNINSINIYYKNQMSPAYKVHI